MMGKTGKLWLATAVASLALGCGGEESQPAAGGGAPAAPAPNRDPAQVMQEMYEWDPTAGAARDLAADSAECQSQTTAEGLSGVAEHIACMQRKGWKTRPPTS